MSSNVDETYKLSEAERMIWKFSDKDRVPMGTENEIADLCDIFEMSEKDLMGHIRGPKLNVRQAGKMLGVQRRCVYGMIASGEIIAFRLKNSLRISQKSIESYIAKKILI